MVSDPDELNDLVSTCPDVVAEGLRRLTEIMDPEAVNARAFADQARRVQDLGGTEAILAREMFDYTPADSR